MKHIILVLVLSVATFVVNSSFPVYAMKVWPGYDFRVTGMAYDSSTDTMYGHEVTTQQLITIDLKSAAVTVVGPTGSGSLSLAYDSSTDTLYSVDNGPDALVTVNRTTGMAIIVGSLGGPPYNAKQSLAYDSSTDTLFGLDGNSLISIDRITGAGTLVTSVPKVVPIPAAFWLFGSALGLLGWV